MITRRLTGAVLLAGLGSLVAWGTTPGCPVLRERAPLGRLEEHLRRVPVHTSDFSPLAEPLALPRCEDVRPPEALATPDPLLRLTDENLRVRISFIVGADGRVHSAFVMESGGPQEDQAVLRAVRRWRFRPAMCNGVPTDSEARVQFGLR